MVTRDPWVYLSNMAVLDRGLANQVWSAAEVYAVLEWLLKKIVVRLPSRTITSPDGRPYLTRWYLWPRRPRTADGMEPLQTPFAVFIHFFHRSDMDRDQHNHPFDKSWALILKGGYIEERGDKRRVFYPGMVNVITKDDYHRVDLIYPARGSWSLFIAGKNVGSWGFKRRTTGEHVPWDQYVGGKNTVI